MKQAIELRVSRRLFWLALVSAIVALRTLSIYTESVNWDEFNLVHNAAWTLQSGELHAGGRPGLAVLALLPFVGDCENEIEVIHRARLLWMLFTLSGLLAFGLVLRHLHGDPSRRNVDAIVGVALLALVPEFLTWSIQIRADQLAIAATMWGGVALLGSKDRPQWATAAGLLFGAGFLASQKSVYLIALVGLLAAVDAWRSQDRDLLRVGLRVVLCVSATGLVVVGFYALMPQIFDGGRDALAPALSAPLPALSADIAGRQYSFQMGVFDYSRSTIGFSEYREMLPHLVPHLCFLALMMIATVRDVVRRRVGDVGLLVGWGVLVLGTAVGLFHAAAFKYFWMTLGVFPAVALVCARESVVSWLDGLGRPVRRAAVLLVWAALLVPAGIESKALLEDSQAVQRETFDLVRRNFERTDAGFQAEAGLFCNGDANRFPPFFSQLIERKFGVASGCESCAPDLIDEFIEKQVKYVVASFRLTQFPPMIQTFWQDNYLPYRASLLVAGKFLKAERDSGRVDLVVDGEYLWLPNRPPAEVSIDGKRVRTGERVKLARGRHDVSFPDAETEGMLVLAMDAPPKTPLLPFYREF